MAKFQLKRVSEDFFRIEIRRQKAGSVWRKAGEASWSASIETKRGKVTLDGFETHSWAFMEIVAAANRVSLGVAHDDQAGAREALQRRNEKVEEAARRINQEAGRQVVQVSSSRVDV